MLISPIGRVFGSAPGRRDTVTTLAVATFALLCAACTEASADCRDEVAAAFERLKTSGRPYRKEVTLVVSTQQTLRGTAEFLHQTVRGTAEFLPPDRMREIKSRGVASYETYETIQVGQRAWSSVGGRPWGWREWHPVFMQKLLEGGKDFSTLPDPAIATDDMFECLGRVEFMGTAYLGYRARRETKIATIASGPLSGTKQQELDGKLQQMLPWRTVFIDPQSMLPAYDLVAQENQLDSPSHKVRYTYPNNITIEPPIWCRVGLCPFVRESEQLGRAAGQR